MEIIFEFKDKYSTRIFKNIIAFRMCTEALKIRDKSVFIRIGKDDMKNLLNLSNIIARYFDMKDCRGRIRNDNNFYICDVIKSNSFEITNMLNSKSIFVTNHEIITCSEHCVFTGINDDFSLNFNYSNIPLNIKNINILEFE